MNEPRLLSIVAFDHSGGTIWLITCLYPPDVVTCRRINSSESFIVHYRMTTGRLTVRSFINERLRARFWGVPRPPRPTEIPACRRALQPLKKAAVCELRI